MFVSYHNGAAENIKKSMPRRRGVEGEEGLVHRSEAVDASQSIVLAVLHEDRHQICNNDWILENERVQAIRIESGS